MGQAGDAHWVGSGQAGNIPPGPLRRYQDSRPESALLSPDSLSSNGASQYLPGGCLMRLKALLIT